VTEALIGIAALVFHDVFVSATTLAFDRVIPGLGSPAAIETFKWALAALLLLPQSLLLGMTFPLMTGGVLRLRPERSGYAIAMLYFTNSLGAALGVLASGFYFIPEVGLPGTLTAAAVINLAVAGAVILLPRGPGATAAASSSAQPAQRAPSSNLRLLLAVAALTGVSSFMYEIGWIRMLSLVLGSSTQAFELMLSAFILGIAFGGLWVRRRIDAARDSLSLLAYVQVAMGLAALATLPVYGSTFRLMQLTMQSLSNTESGYLAFNLVSHGICLAVMFPAAFCAGMTLPLITASLLSKGVGERAIGWVYAANTAGAIAGVAVAVHLALPLLGLKGLIVAGAVIDLALGVLLLAMQQGAWRRAPAAAAAVLSTVAVLAAVFIVRLDAHQMASGIYQYGALAGKTAGWDVVFQRDGKTATVSLTGDREVLALRTNGKSDGAIRISGAPTTDMATMTLLGALPLFLAPGARRVANIGFGTGMTTHVLLASKSIEAVDTVEIEPAIVQAAVHFRPFNQRALDDPRSHVHYDDAKSYFAARQVRYDVIVSEPSNPWVSGIAGLFSIEFYRAVRRHLREGGLFLQWVQVYDITPELLATVISALEANFRHYELWMPNAGDLIIVAANGTEVPRPDPRAFGNAALRVDLERLRIRNLDDLLLHRVAGDAAIGPYFAAFGAQANSDFFPVLERKAPQYRFMRVHSNDIVSLLESPVPVLSIFDSKPHQRLEPARLTPGERLWWQRSAFALEALAATQYLRSGNIDALNGVPAAFGAELILLRASLVECRLKLTPAASSKALADAARYLNPHLPRAQRDAVWRLLGNSRCQAGEPERRWLRLQIAVSAQAPAGMVTTAHDILDSETEMPQEFVATALAAYMTGLILSSESAAALKAFQAYRRKVPSSGSWQPVFRFLVAQAGNGALQATPTAAK
jgi:spermidine synthase